MRERCNPGPILGAGHRLGFTLNQQTRITTPRLIGNDHVRHVVKSPGMLSSMFEGVFLECKNSSWAIVNRK